MIIVASVEQIASFSVEPISSCHHLVTNRTENHIYSFHYCFQLCYYTTSLAIMQVIFSILLNYFRLRPFRIIAISCAIPITKIAREKLPLSISEKIVLINSIILYKKNPLPLTFLMFYQP